jgi:hypothetical protein
MPDDTDEMERRSAFAAAMTTEHFVLQTAIATTINDNIGPLIGYLTTGASMIACINAIVAGAGITLLLHQLLGRDVAVPLLIGGACAAILLALFFFYQRYRISGLVDTWEKPTGSDSTLVDDAGSRRRS